MQRQGSFAEGEYGAEKKQTRRDWGQGPEWTRGGPTVAARRSTADL